ncbi:MAG: hypothetical protein GC191_02215 [Azospirillum sp.]|nr:hypothetical protein [Azospirillum sp.]
MNDQVIYQDGRIRITTAAIEAGAASCPIDDIDSAEAEGGTGPEEKIFLGLIIVFLLGVGVVGGLARDLGEVLLGFSMAAVTFYAMIQQARLVLRTAGGKRAILADRNAAYVRLIRRKLMEAIRAHRAAPGDSLPIAA